MMGLPLGFAQPLLRHIEAVRGLNPLEIYRYNKYVQFISDQDTLASVKS